MGVLPEEAVPGLRGIYISNNFILRIDKGSPGGALCFNILIQNSVYYHALVYIF